MASVTEQTTTGANGGTAAATIAVENPATGELITTVPLMGSVEIGQMAARARDAQPGWEAMGFDGRGKVLRRAQKWMVDNVDRIIDVVVSETGKTYEDAQGADYSATAAALGFWAKEAPKYLQDEHVSSWGNPVVAGKKLIIRYAPVGVVGVIGPWNYPITNSFGDCIPALAAGNSVILKPSEVTPLSSLLMEEMLRECGIPESVFQVATGDGSTGAALVDQVDCIMFTGSTKTGKAVMKAAADRLIPCYLELGRQGPDDRAHRRQPRSRRQRRRVLLDEQRRPGVHLGRARVCRGADLRPVRGEGHRQRRQAQAGCPGRDGLGRRRGGHVPAADRDRRRARSGTPSRRAPRSWSVAIDARARGASTSRPCSSTWTTR